MVNKTYKALIFDFDGTLFDTEGLNFQAYRLAYYDLGIEITEEQFRRTKGLSVYAFNRAMGVDCDVERLRELKAKYYAEMSVWARPNKYLINIIRTSEIPVAIVTTARRCNIKPLLDKYDIDEACDMIVCQEDVLHHKPAPDAYLRVLDFWGIAPEDVLAFEDSRTGFVAARAAGCDCVKIGEFWNDCIVDLTGGSNSRTSLLYHEGQLVVRKDARGEINAEKLKKEFLFLANNKHPYLVPIKAGEFSVPEVGSYTMPYVFGGSFYEYQNKIGMFPEVIRRVAEFDLYASDIVENKEEIRYKCFELYLIPGSSFYPGVIDSSVFDLNIPDFVNDFRITRCHGDTTFENIIMSRVLGPVLIDPVPYGNAVSGIVHDFSKLGQSLCGYEAIRDGRDFDYRVERQIFDEQAKKWLTESEYKSLKFLVACLFFRRLKYQIKQNPALVKVYGDIGLRLLTEFRNGEYAWA